MQVGLECIGDIDDYCIYEVIMLAAKSLENISKDYVLDISHLGIVSAVTETLGVDGELKSEIIKCIGEKNTYEIEKLCKDAGVNPENAVKLVSTYGSPKKVIAVLKEMNIKNADEQVARLESITSVLEKEGFNVSIDFSVINDMNYYNGFVFKGFIKGISSGVLCGGQYDKLMKKMGRTSGAIGFAVYLDMLERLAVNNKKYDVDTLIVYDDKCTISAINKAIELFSSDTVSVMAQRSVPERLKYRQLLRLNVALPKGRLGEKVYSMFEKAGFECPSIRETNRKLIFENPQKNVRYFWVKPSDVAIYVERGAADVGVAGKDILLEYEPEVYELLDLGIGKCKMAVAAKKDFYDNTQRTLRVATKFTNITKSYYSALGRDIDIIHLNGSIEIAPILDLSDVIVDIVETGTTLKENNLSVIDTIIPISARLIANKSGFKFKGDAIEKLISELAGQI